MGLRVEKNSFRKRFQPFRNFLFERLLNSRRNFLPALLRPGEQLVGKSVLTAISVAQLIKSFVFPDSEGDHDIISLEIIERRKRAVFEIASFRQKARRSLSQVESRMAQI